MRYFSKSASRSLADIFSLRSPPRPPSNPTLLLLTRTRPFAAPMSPTLSNDNYHMLVKMKKIQLDFKQRVTDMSKASFPSRGNIREQKKSRDWKVEVSSVKQALTNLSSTSTFFPFYFDYKWRQQFITLTTLLVLVVNGIVGTDTTLIPSGVYWNWVFIL